MVVAFGVVIGVVRVSLRQYRASARRMEVTPRLAEPPAPPTMVDAWRSWSARERVWGCWAKA